MTGTADFRRRALSEASRYAGDDWVFVRELLQNARDAGAAVVDITVERHDGREVIRVRDDGCGMTYSHARRYLFTLYATSKRDQRDRAGRFGIGFWSILRFDPDRVVVRSAPAGGPPWQVRFSGDLERIERSDSELTRGTEVELGRVAGSEDLVHRVWRAVRRDARHLRRLGSDDDVLEVRVNSRPATSGIELAAPSLVVRRRGLRVAAALAATPRVDLLAHGLRVRTAATLDELLTGPDAPHRRRLPRTGALMPRVILDSRRLQVLMARGDARSDRELRRSVELGRRAVRRLVSGQLDREANLGRVARAGARICALARSRPVGRIAAASAMVALLALGGRWVLDRPRPEASIAATSTAAVGVGGVDRASAVLDPAAAERYLGPTVERLRPVAPAIDLTFRPPAKEPMFAVIRVAGLDASGRVVAAERRVASAPPAPCTTGCLAVELNVAGDLRAVRLPIPTGHRLDPDSVVAERGGWAVGSAPDGVPIVVFDRPYEGVVRYRTGPAADLSPIAPAVWPPLPAGADEAARRWRGVTADHAARAAERWVAERVAYDSSDATVERHHSAARAGLDFGERCLEVGAGDCDVLNGLVASLLHRAGFDVRLSIGFIGSNGRVLPGLHAWVELRGADGSWRIADASRLAPRRPAMPGPIPAVPPSTDVIAEPPGTSASGPVGAMVNRTTAMWIALAIAAVAMIGGVGVRRRWVVDDVRWSNDADLAGLLRGALERPEAFGQIPELFTRPVVPTLSGGAIDLDRARALARRGRLGHSAEDTDLARQAGRHGWTVLDGRRDEASVVAVVLGAVDLDLWDRLIREGRADPIGDRLETALRAVGDRSRVVIGSDVPGGVAVLAGLGPATVTIDGASDLWHRVRTIAAKRPAAALFVLGEIVAGRLAMPANRRRCLVRRLAADCLVEHMEVGS